MCSVNGGVKHFGPMFGTLNRAVAGEVDCNRLPVHVRPGMLCEMEQGVILYRVHSFHRGPASGDGMTSDMMRNFRVHWLLPG